MHKSDSAQDASWANAWKLMRIPFSIFLMPIFWFALIPLEWTGENIYHIALQFLILHLFVYPASNGYNSYFDRDESPIGGLESPPPVSQKLWYLVLAFDGLAVVLSLLIGWKFALGILIYLLVSKAYSWDKIRLKKWPLISTLVVVGFQGGFTFFLIGMPYDLQENFVAFNPILALVSSLFLAGSYPLTQIYQHKEDAERGDKTLSILLGIKGTFLFAGGLFTLATGLLFYTFWQTNHATYFYIYLAATVPVVGFYSSWFSQYLQGNDVINYRKAMQMNKISSICLSVAFLGMIFFN